MYSRPLSFYFHLKGTKFALCGTFPTNVGFYTSVGTGQRERRRHVRFAEAFRTAPAVQCTVAMWDVAGGTNQRGDVAAESVTGEGFELVFRTWSDTRIARLRVRWMAIGELAHVDDWSV